MTDPRLGYRNGSGVITEKPTQYADGGTCPTDVLLYSPLVFLDANYFAALRPGTEVLTSAQESALLAARGASGIIGNYNDVLGDLGLAEITNIGIFDDFEGASLTAANWNTDVNGTSAAITVPNNTGLTLCHFTTGGDDDAWTTLTTDLTFESDSTLLIAEARLKVASVANIIIEFGFSDAASEAAGIAFTSHDSTPVATATNACLFGFQNDVGGEVNTTWNALNVKAGSAVRTAITDAPSADTFYHLAVVLAKNGSQVDASWFIDGTQVATKTDVVAVDIPLYFWLTLKAKTNAAKTADIDWARAYLKR